MIVGFITVIVGASLVPTLVTIINGTISELNTAQSGAGAETNIALTNSSNTTLAIKSTVSNAVCSSFSAVNASGGETILAGGNYSFNGDSCNFIFADSSPYLSGEGNLSYSYSGSTISGTQGSSASLLELTILFFALGVMIAGVGTSVSGLVEYGLI